MTRLLRISASCFFVALLAATLPAQTYKAIGEYKVPGTSAKGIAVDSDGRRLFVAGSDGIAVLNADTGASMGTVGGLKGAQDVLLIPAMNGEEPAPSTKGFASDDSGHVIAFSLADMKPLATIKLDTPGPASLCYDIDAKTVEAVSAGGSLTSIDADTNKVVKSGTVVTGKGQAVCGNMDHVYVADPDANVVHVLNHRTMKNDGDYPMRTGNKPTGLALDTKGRRLFVSCDDGVIEVIDTDAGFTFIELKGGSGPARGDLRLAAAGQRPVESRRLHRAGGRDSLRRSDERVHQLLHGWAIQTQPGSGRRRLRRQDPSSLYLLRGLWCSGRCRCRLLTNLAA